MDRTPESRNEGSRVFVLTDSQRRVVRVSTVYTDTGEELDPERYLGRAPSERAPIVKADVREINWGTHLGGWSGAIAGVFAGGWLATQGCRSENSPADLSDDVFDDCFGRVISGGILGAVVTSIFGSWLLGQAFTFAPGEAEIVVR